MFDGPLGKAALEAASETVKRNVVPGQPVDIDHVVQWAVGAALRSLVASVEARKSPPPREGEVLRPAPSRREVSKAQGFTGHPCGACGNFTLVQNGTCLACKTCGETSGCS